MGTELEKTSPYFENGALAATITNPYSREFGAAIFSFVGAKIDIRPIIQKEIEKTKEY